MAIDNHQADLFEDIDKKVKAANMREINGNHGNCWDGDDDDGMLFCRSRSCLFHTQTAAAPSS